MVRSTLAIVAGTLLPLAGLALGVYVCFFLHAESVVGTDFFDYSVRHDRAALARNMATIWVSFGVLISALVVTRRFVAASSQTRSGWLPDTLIATGIVILPTYAVALIIGIAAYQDGTTLPGGGDTWAFLYWSAGVALVVINSGILLVRRRRDRRRAVQHGE